MYPRMADTGTIYLVGAGPGDPDLLTLRAARLIEGADLIVHDGLVDPAILAMARKGAMLISVAKRRSKHTLPQDDINALLVREAKAGRSPVRLKGGDPLIFGRGGEEAEAARAAGVSPRKATPCPSRGSAAKRVSSKNWRHRTSRSPIWWATSIRSRRRAP